jgi:penicillin amidase
MTDTSRLLNDVRAWNASQLIRLLENIRSLPNNLESARSRLTRWGGIVDAESADAALYIAWEEAIRRLLVDKAGVPDQLLEDFVSFVDPVSLMTRPTAAWFPGDVVRGRDVLLVDALATASAARESGQRLPRTATFEHPLAVFEPAKRRFNVGPVPQPGYAETVFATGRHRGPFFSAVFDLSHWDGSMVINLPGQSGSPASPNYADFAARWVSGDSALLSFARKQDIPTSQTMTLSP